YEHAICQRDNPPISERSGDFIYRVQRSKLKRFITQLWHVNVPWKVISRTILCHRERSIQFRDDEKSSAPTLATPTSPPANTSALSIAPAAISSYNCCSLSPP